MIIEKLREIKRYKELVAIKVRLDDKLPTNPDKIYRELDAKMFYVQHVFQFDSRKPPECQDIVLLIIGDNDRYLKEGDDISFVSDHQDDFFSRHDIPGGYWQGINNDIPDTYKCSGYCQQCGQKCNKERHF